MKWDIDGVPGRASRAIDQNTGFLQKFNNIKGEANKHQTPLLWSSKYSNIFIPELDFYNYNI